MLQNPYSSAIPQQATTQPVISLASSSPQSLDSPGNHGGNCRHPGGDIVIGPRQWLVPDLPGTVAGALPRTKVTHADPDDDREASFYWISIDGLTAKVSQRETGGTW
jgi:hypothetical protein